jgi:DNA-directed RNA polymerase specialized sigma24 family protein
MSYSKIAEKLKISAGTVKTQMSRAFQKFREEFGEFLPLLIILSFLELFR